MAKQKYYAVRAGKAPGVYLTWEECKEQVHGFSGADYKSFPTRSEAETYVGADGPETAEEQTETERLPELVREGSGYREEIFGRVPSDGTQPEEGTAIAYVDGSYNVSTKEYSCGVVFLTETEEIRIAKKGESRELAEMRNVAGEILGARIAMERAMELELGKLSIYHDYQGIASWCLGEWKTNKEGTKAYKAYFDSIRDRIEIRFVKVKGHSGDKYNDAADELAKSMVFRNDQRM